VSRGKGRKTDRKSRPQEPQLLTRKDFLKEMGTVVGGAALASLAFNSACGSPGNNTTSNPTADVNSNTINSSTGNTVTSGTTTNTGLPPAEGFVYKTPQALPPRKPIPGCTTSVATDRMYTVDHLWVKMVAKNIVAIGITEKMATLVDNILAVNLPKEGRTIIMGDFLIYIESSKMNVELPAPVSGTILQVNNEIFTDLVYRVNGDPYVRGWLVTMQLSNPTEWDTLITPEVYSELNKIVK
jgi:glycine cleavage system H protein